MIKDYVATIKSRIEKIDDKFSTLLLYKYGTTDMVMEHLAKNAEDVPDPHALAVNLLNIANTMLHESLKLNIDSYRYNYTEKSIKKNEDRIAAIDNYILSDITTVGVLKDISDISEYFKNGEKLTAFIEYAINYPPRAIPQMALLESMVITTIDNCIISKSPDYTLSVLITRDKPIEATDTVFPLDHYKNVNSLNMDLYWNIVLAVTPSNYVDENLKYMIEQKIDVESLIKYIELQSTLSLL